MRLRTLPLPHDPSRYLIIIDEAEEGITPTDCDGIEGCAGILAFSDRVELEPAITTAAKIDTGYNIATTAGPYPVAFTRR